MKPQYTKNLTGGTNVRIPAESNNQAMPSQLREKIRNCLMAQVVIKYVDDAGRVFVVTQEA